MAQVASYAGTWWRALTAQDSAGEVVHGNVDRGFDAFLLCVIFACYAFYGASMGLFAGITPALVSALKFPLLHLLTIGVCLTPFYVVLALSGCPIGLRGGIRLLLLLASANAIAVASYVPISAFYGLTTSAQGYAFLVLMHVFVLACSGAASLAVNAFVIRGTSRSMGRPLRPAALGVWVVLYGVVGAHMAWTLRPWLNKPSLEYEPIRPIGGSFPGAVMEHLSSYMGW